MKWKNRGQKGNMNDIARRDTVEQLVALYNRIRREATAGYRLMNRAQTSFRDRIYQYGRLNASQHDYTDWTEDALARVLERIRRETWRGIMDKLNVRGVMDSERRNKLDKQLETGDGLPEITTEAVLDVIHGMIGQVGDFATAQIREAFELIRRKSDGYKSTGQAWKIENKAVLGWMCEQGYGGHPFRLSYHAENDARTIESAFRLLDGKGPLQSHTAEFAGVLNSSPAGEGETEYFRFRAHKNRNLHVWFKRMDLVERMNEMAGGERVLRAG